MRARTWNVPELRHLLRSWLRLSVAVLIRVVAEHRAPAVVGPWLAG
jgi:hypothetical protein